MSDILDRALPFGEEDPYVDMLCLSHGPGLSSGVTAIDYYDNAREHGLTPAEAYEFARTAELPRSVVLIYCDDAQAPQQIPIDSLLHEYALEHSPQRRSISQSLATIALRGAQNIAVALGFTESA